MSHIPGFVEPQKSKQRHVNKSGPFKKRKVMNKTITHLKVRNLLYLGKAIAKLKSDGVITILPSTLDWAEDEISIAVHCAPREYYE